MSEPRQLAAPPFPTLSSEDTISLTQAGTPDATSVKFVLETGQKLDWWKGLELRSKFGNTLSLVETHNNDRGPKTFSALAADLVGTKLILAKAKWPWQQRTEMYEIENLSGLGGKSLHFLWERDDDQAGPVVGFFKDLGKAICDAANTLATWVETSIETVAEAISFIIEYAGSFVARFSEAIGDVFAAIPGVGGFFKGVFHWFGTVASAVFDWAATSIKAAMDSSANILAGVIRMVGGGIGGLLAWDGRLFARGFGDIVAGFVGSITAAVAKSIASVQATFGMQLGERELTQAEREVLARVYRSSLNLELVRVIDGFAGVFSATPNAFTLGNKIYMKNYLAARGAAFYLQTLVHECCHVWQSQHIGARYIADALWSQWTLGSGPGPSAYTWEDELTRGNFRWQDFNKEAQARFLEDIFAKGERLDRGLDAPGDFYVDDPIGPNVRFMPVLSGTLTDLTPLARESVGYVRSAQWPLSSP